MKIFSQDSRSQDSGYEGCGRNYRDLLSDTVVSYHVPEETREVHENQSGYSEIRTGY
jgi:hypothetical protein